MDNMVILLSLKVVPSAVDEVEREIGMSPLYFLPFIMALASVSTRPYFKGF